jgi:hypothetical protein
MEQTINEQSILKQKADKCQYLLYQLKTAVEQIVNGMYDLGEIFDANCKSHALYEGYSPKKLVITLSDDDIAKKLNDKVMSSNEISDYSESQNVSEYLHKKAGEVYYEILLDMIDKDLERSRQEQ